MDSTSYDFDAIVVGGGHAGIEAAAAIARSYLQDPDVAIGRLDPMSYRGQDACPGGEDDDSDATCGP